MIVHGTEPCGCLRRCSQLPGLRPRAVYRARSLFPILFGCLGCRGIPVPKVAASNDSSSSRAKYVSITLTSLGRTAMSSGKSSTTSQAGSHCFAALSRTRCADRGRRAHARNSDRYPRLGEREPATLWPRRDAVRLAGGGDGRPSSDACLRLANLEAPTRLIMSVRPWRRTEEIVAPSWIRTSQCWCDNRSGLLHRGCSAGGTRVGRLRGVLCRGDERDRLERSQPGSDLHAWETPANCS
jgi:hypothetical protein